MRVVVLSNQKGGPGKTTLSVHLAMWLAERCGERVCLVDLDSQGNATKSLRECAMAGDAVTLFEGAASFVPVSGATLQVLRATPALVDIERASPQAVLPAFRARVAALAGAVDTCVIDTPPALGLRMTAALMAADHVVCPIELEEYSLDGLSHMLCTVFGVRSRYNPRLALAGIVANRFNPHSARQKEALRRLLSDYRDFVVPAKISTRSAIPEALAEGRPVWRIDKSSAREAASEMLTVFGLLRERMGAPSTVPEAA